MTNRKPFDDLSPAEARLSAAFASGETIRLGADVPDEATPERTVRADFLRHLILARGPDSPIDPKGIHIIGAFIQGLLDLERFRATETLWLGLEHCRFEAPPNLSAARFLEVGFEGSHMPGLNAEHLHTNGRLVLDSVVSKGEIALGAATIGGNLEADDLVICCPGAKALEADRAEIGDTVFLRGARIEGEVRFLGAQIAGDLSFAGLQIKNSGGDALSCGAMTVGAAFFWREGAQVEGEMDLTAASCELLVDAAESWPAKGDLVLDGFTYNRIVGPVSAAHRLDWLGRQQPEAYGADFWPQTYEQCAAVLRGMGHRDEARAIMIERECQQRRAGVRRLLRRADAAAARGPDDGKDHPPGEAGLLRLRARLASGWSRVLRNFVGYGHAPLRALGWGVGAIMLGFVVFGLTYQANVMVPSSSFDRASADWKACEAAPIQGDCYHTTARGKDYEPFNPFVYAADVFVPVIDLRQDSAWMPSASRGTLGPFAWVFRWLMIVSGWLISTLGLAAASGLIRND